MVASQAHGVRERTGLTTSQTERAVWTVTGDVRVGGPHAIALFLAVAFNSQIPLTVWRLPVLPRLSELVYEQIARNRHRLPGQTPWCVEHPGSCVPPPD